MFGTILILIGLALALSPTDGPAQASHAGTGLAGPSASSASGAPIAALLRGIERPLPSAGQVVRLAEGLGLDAAGRRELAAVVAAAADERRRGMADVLGGRAASAVLAVVDEHDGRPRDEALMPVGREIVEVGRALRAVDEQAHAAVWREVQRLTSAGVSPDDADPASLASGGAGAVGERIELQTERRSHAERFLRRVRVLDAAPAPSARQAREGVLGARRRGAGIDLLATCQAAPVAGEAERGPGGGGVGDGPASNLRCGLAELLRRFDDRRDVDGMSVHPGAPEGDDALAALAGSYATDLDAALRVVERREAAIADAAERAVTSGERAGWDAAIEAKVSALRLAALVGERAADDVAAIIARERSQEEALVWRQDVRRATHPGLFPSEPVADLHAWLVAQAPEPQIEAAIAAQWREYLLQREPASAAIVRLSLAAAPGPSMLVAAPAVSGAGGDLIAPPRVHEAVRARARLDGQAVAGLLSVVPAEWRQAARARADADLTGRQDWTGRLDWTARAGWAAGPGGLSAAGSGDDGRSPSSGGTGRRHDAGVGREVGERDREIPED